MIDTQAHQHLQVRAESKPAAWMLPAPARTQTRPCLIARILRALGV